MKYTKDNPLKVIELFSGIGSQRSALEKAGIPHKVVAISEIDKFALKSYNEMYNHCLDSGETINLGDITKIDPNDAPDCDFMSYSFPCTDLSIAGRQQGMDMNSGTRSSLLWECERLIKAKKPKYLMLENVKMLVSKKFKPQFDIWLQKLSDIGYNTYWKVLNAKDFGVPQNRERVFAISIRKDIDDKTFEFPKPFKLEKRLKDVLEPKVNNKFYLKPELVNRFKFIGNHSTVNNTKVLTTIDYKDTKRVTTSPVGDLNHFAHRHMNAVFGGESISPTLSTMQGGNTQPKVITTDIPINPLKGLTGKSWQFEQQIYDPHGIARTIKANGGSGNIPKVLIKANNKKGYNEAHDGDSISLDHPNSDKKHSRVTKNVSRTLTTSQDVGVIRLKYNKDDYVDFSIRKLTPKECWRLMGFSDSQFEKAESVCSNTQLYKQAGNSIVVDVMEYIFKNLFNG